MTNRQVRLIVLEMSQLINELRRALEKSDISRYRIAKDTGLSEGHLSRLMSGERQVRIETFELLAEYLGLEIVIRPKRRKRGK